MDAAWRKDIIGRLHVVAETADISPLYGQAADDLQLVSQSLIDMVIEFGRRGGPADLLLPPERQSEAVRAAMRVLGKGYFAYAEPNESENVETFATADTDWPARAVVDGDCITIRVPISVLPTAFECLPGHYGLRDEEGNPRYRVTDTALWARSLVERLNEEQEDGTTPIHIMLDKAAVKALEWGEEGISEIAHG